MIIDNMSPTAWLQVGACVPHGTVIKMQVNPSVILQGDFFNWPPPEFAKCWPVSN